MNKERELLERVVAEARVIPDATRPHTEVATVSSGLLDEIKAHLAPRTTATKEDGHGKSQRK